jgi:hypothetical protein
VLTQPGLAASEPVSGTFSIELLDPNGRPAGKPMSFDAQFIDPEGERLPTVSFNLLLPASPNAVKIVLKKGDQVLDEIVRSAGTPGAQITSPAAGDVLSGTATIKWDAFDSDTDLGDLRFSLMYTPDDGASWYPLANGVQGASYDVDTSALPGGAGGKFRIIVTDGVNTSQSDTAGAFAVEGGAPIVTISEPSAAKAEEGAPITFSGDAATLSNQELPDNAFVWTYAAQAGPQIAQATPLGIGRSIEASLPAGSYAVTLTVTGSDGKQGSATRTLVVGAAGNSVYLPVVVK